MVAVRDSGVGQTPTQSRRPRSAISSGRAAECVHSDRAATAEERCQQQEPEARPQRAPVHDRRARPTSIPGEDLTPEGRSTRRGELAAERRQRIARSIRPPSSGNAGNRFETASTTLISASHSSSAASTRRAVQRSIDHQPRRRTAPP